MAQNARTRAKLLKPDRLQPPLSAFEAACAKAPEAAGVYLVSTPAKKLYAGGALNLKLRFKVQFGSGREDAWEQHGSSGELQVRLCTAEANFADLIAYQSILIRRHKPRLNAETLAAG
jgi:hypothetical protein